MLNTVYTDILLRSFDFNFLGFVVSMKDRIFFSYTVGPLLYNNMLHLFTEAYFLNLLFFFYFSQWIFHYHKKHVTETGFQKCSISLKKRAKK